MNLETLLKLGTREPQDEYDWNRVVQEIAEEKGCKVLRPEPNQLFLDFDTDAEFQKLPDRICDLLKDRDCPFSMEEWFSKSGAPHRHVILTFRSRTFTASERVLYQLLLGSDPKREFLDSRRLFHGVSAENTTCFFEPKEETK
jgi:hypothetical protein